MPLYRYIADAAAPHGAPRRGELSADSAYQVRLLLRRMGLLPIRIDEVRPARAARGVRRLLPAVEHVIMRLQRRRRQGALVEFYEGLATLIATGTPVTAALDTLAGDAGDRRPIATTCRHLAERLRRGDGFGDTAADPGFSGWFSPVDAALIRVAEQGGELDVVLGDLAEHHARSEQLAGKLAAALAYPALLLVFGIGVVLFLTTTTLPPLAAVLSDASVPLPWATTLLLHLGRGLLHGWPLALGMGVLVVSLVVWLIRTPVLARLRLKLPLVGTLIRRGQTGEAALLLARLLRGGLPLTEALVLTAPTIGNAALRRGFLTLGDEFRAGRDGAVHLESCGVFEPVFVRIMMVGQATGELVPALETIGRRFRSSAQRLTDRLAAVLEPAVILVLAAMVGFVVYAAITPMLRLGQTIA